MTGKQVGKPKKKPDKKKAHQKKGIPGTKGKMQRNFYSGRQYSWKNAGRHTGSYQK